MKSNFANSFDPNVKEMFEFKKFVEDGDIDAMLLAAANIAAWSTSLMKGLDKVAGKMNMKKR